jgi:hypothetical protein
MGERSAAAKVVLHRVQTQKALTRLRVRAQSVSL